MVMLMGRVLWCWRFGRIGFGVLVCMVDRNTLVNVEHVQKSLWNTVYRNTTSIDVRQAILCKYTHFSIVWIYHIYEILLDLYYSILGGGDLKRPKSNSKGTEPSPNQTGTLRTRLNFLKQIHILIWQLMRGKVWTPTLPNLKGLMVTTSLGRWFSLLPPWDHKMSMCP